MQLAGGIEIHGATPEQERLLKAREFFVLKYVADKGWNFNNLTIEQALEIRGQVGWKHPAGSSPMGVTAVVRTR